MLGSTFQAKMAESGLKKGKESNEVQSELDAPIWSVVSFERCEASGLTYPEATQKVTELEARNVTGLCIVTDEAATRITA